MKSINICKKCKDIGAILVENSQILTTKSITLFECPKCKSIFKRQKRFLYKT